MKTELEPQDIEAIAQRVSEILRPLISHIQKTDAVAANDVLDVRGLANYLHVQPSWVYKQVSLNAIPYFKAGKYPRFRKRDIDKWIDSRTARPIPLLRVANSGR